MAMLCSSISNVYEMRSFLDRLTANCELFKRAPGVSGETFGP